jgi:murein L,D-transpeptidase YafK
MKYERVRKAYQEKEAEMLHVLDYYKINRSELQLYIRIFKNDKLVELWAKNKSNQSFQLLKKFSICSTSGVLGPKRKEGDWQTPEGFYYISRFNPSSNFYLSLGINYPNQSDLVFSDKKHPGGDIYIHGNCVTIGCVPITDDKIKELYIYCVEARTNGQKNIPVTIFPALMDDKTYEKLSSKYAGFDDNIKLWDELKIAYDLFNEKKAERKIHFLANGRHGVK